MHSFLENIERRQVHTTAGPCELPVLYRDGAQIGVFFRVRTERAAALLEGTDLEPWTIGGAAVAAIYAWEYRDTSIGAYNELGLGIQARRRGSRPSLTRFLRDPRAQRDQGIWVVNLPVTTEAAHAAGVELWGYPKYVAAIETSFTIERARVRLGDELELTVGRFVGPRIRLPVVTFTSNASRLQRTVIEVDHRVTFGRGGHARLRLLGDGPTAASARALGLHEVRPIAVFRTDSFRAVLPAGTPV